MTRYKKYIKENKEDIIYCINAIIEDYKTESEDKND